MSKEVTTQHWKNGLVGLILNGCLMIAAHAADNSATTGVPTNSPVTQPAADTVSSTAVPAARKHSPYHGVNITEKAKTYYQSQWGVDHLRAQRTASGNLIRFSYRVVDPGRATPLGDKKATPYMYGLRSRAMLQIPVMDKVGALRQSGTPVAGKEYWMTFSNKGEPVKKGDRVNVVIGPFHVDGLAVE
jgi:hypothetical protein